MRWRRGARDDSWPASTEPVLLCVASTEAEATMMRGLLAENDIDAAIAPSGGLDLRSLYGAGGRCLLLVLPSDLEEARALIATPLRVTPRRARGLRPHGGALRRAAARPMTRGGSSSS